MYIPFLKRLNASSSFLLNREQFNQNQNAACFHVVARPEGTLFRVCTSEPLNPQSSYRELSGRTRSMFLNELISSIITLEKHNVTRHK